MVRVIEPSHEILDRIDGQEIMDKLERAGRTAYKSEDKITDGSAEKFIRAIVSRGHESVIEHANVSVKFICDRGVTHEIVRHRLCAYTQESTRYCNYGKLGMTVIRPFFWAAGSEEYALWLRAMEASETAYNELLSRGATPQQARAVLPHSLKTEIVCTANLREWRHILRLRTSKDSHPQIRQIMIPLLKDFQRNLPTLFNDIAYKDL